VKACTNSLCRSLIFGPYHIDTSPQHWPLIFIYFKYVVFFEHTTQPQANNSMHSFTFFYRCIFFVPSHNPAAQHTMSLKKGKLMVSHFWTIPHGHKPTSLSTHLLKKSSLSFLDHPTRPQASSTTHYES
jgi:hypothetical protein